MSKEINVSLDFLRRRRLSCLVTGGSGWPPCGFIIPDDSLVSPDEQSPISVSDVNPHIFFFYFEACACIEVERDLYNITRILTCRTMFRVRGNGQLEW